MKDILSVVGHPGLYKIIAKDEKKILVQSLEDGSKTFLFPGHQKVISLYDVVVFTEDGSKLLMEVMKDIYLYFDKKPIEYNPKDEKQIRELFEKAVPYYNKQKIHLSDMKKIFKWYNLFVKNNINFEDDGEELKRSENDKKEKEN